MLEQIAKLGVMGFLAVALVATACFVVVYGVVQGVDTETTKAFGTALSGPALGGILVAVGRFFGGSDK